MALSLSLTSGDLPSVLIVIPGTDLPSGDAWSLSGSGGGLTRQVRGGSGTGEGAQVQLVDTLAPLNAEITYSLTVDGAVTQTAAITRAVSPAGNVLASLTGDLFARVKWLAAGGAPQWSERRHHVSQVAGVAHPALRLDPVAGAGGGSVRLGTLGADTDAARGLIESNAPLVLFHDQSQCAFGSCDIPQVAIIYPTSVRSDVRAVNGGMQRVWSLDYLTLADPDPNTATPYQTWADYDAAALTGTAFDLLALTVEEFALTDWATV